MTSTIVGTVTDLQLAGCRPEPLSGYLKALGVFRLVAEQLDPHVKACWSADRFVLTTTATQVRVVEFFEREYRPTPIVTPWNGGSGFYPGDATAGMDAILVTQDPRFEPYRQVIEAVRAWPELGPGPQTVDSILEALKRAAHSKKEGSNQRKELENLIEEVCSKGNHALNVLKASGKWQEFNAVSAGDVDLTTLETKQGNLKTEELKAWWKVVKKARTKCNQLRRAGGKEDLIPICRSRLSEESLPWLDAAVALRNDGKTAYNPMLGSGGNEGRLDFSNNFMQTVATLLIENGEDTRQLLEEALFAKPCTGLGDVKTGQFNPGRAGGFNQGMEVETKEFKANPWDFLLMIEGSLLFGAALYKRGMTEARGYAAIPFTATFSPVGLGSDVPDEAGKAETWLPLWERPATYAEVRALFSEGRASVGRRNAENGIDFARAMGTLGVDRGISRFVRYAYLKRRGDSYVALPAGQTAVRMCPSLLLLEELDAMLDRLDSFLRQFKSVPVTFAGTRRQLEQAIFAACDSQEPHVLIRVLTALGAIERAIAQRERTKLPKLNRPLHGLKPKWLLDADDGSSEFRIAAALASVSATGPVGPIRANLAPVDPAKPWLWAPGNGQRSWHGNSLVERLGGVVAQRMMDAERLSASTPPFNARLPLAPLDVLPFLLGETNDNKIEELLWAFTLVDWQHRDLHAVRRKWAVPLVSGPMPRGWCLLKLLHQPNPIRGKRFRAEPRIIPLLRAGRVDEAVEIARSRLRASEVAPVSLSGDDWIAAERQLAALLVPLGSIDSLEDLVLE